MASEEHLAILRQGVDVWNRWREENPDVQPDLQGTGHTGTRFFLHDFSRANLREANLHGASLIGARLSYANLSGAYLGGADLSLTQADSADFSGANLYNANLRGAKLNGANLHDASIHTVDFTGAELSRTDFAYAMATENVFANNDLSETLGLELVRHFSPSVIAMDVIVRSHGKIPEPFLRGCGVPDALIEYLPSLIGAMAPIQFYSCFISYSHKDEGFAQRLYERMQSHHLRVWYAPEDMKGGAK